MILLFLFKVCNWQKYHSTIGIVCTTEQLQYLHSFDNILNYWVLRWLRLRQLFCQSFWSMKIYVICDPLPLQYVLTNFNISFKKKKYIYIWPCIIWANYCQNPNLFFFNLDRLDSNICSITMHEHASLSKSDFLCNYSKLLWQGTTKQSKTNLRKKIKNIKLPSRYRATILAVSTLLLCFT